MSEIAYGWIYTEPKKKRPFRAKLNFCRIGTEITKLNEPIILKAKTCDDIVAKVEDHYEATIVLEQPFGPLGYRIIGLKDTP